MRISILVILSVLLLNTVSINCQESLVGTFYGGWARNDGDYIWTRDLGSGAQMVNAGDVNGDGFDDAISVTYGRWEIALSESYVDLSGQTVRHFGDTRTWNRGFGSNSATFLLGDINGDQKSDVCAVDVYAGNWTFAVSNGSNFERTDISIRGFGESSSHHFLADINADRQADAIAFKEGTWQVCVNNGDGFDAAVSFISGFGTTHSELLMADVDGDGDADAIHVTNGEVNVSLSDGTGFKPGNAWKGDLLFAEVMAGDATGDNRADLILYNEGTWEICPSDGAGAFGEAESWCRDHGNQTRRLTKCLPAAHRFFVGYAQASRTDQYGVSAIAFNENHGFWQVMPPPGLITSNTPFYYDSWHFHNRAALPLIGEEYYGFDANRDTFAIAELVRQLALAEIDYVLLDQTNPWAALIDSYKLFALEVSKWNRVPGHRKVKYAIAGMFKRGPEDVERSAEYTLRDFLNHPVWGGEENYQYWDGKPLLVCYGGVHLRRRDLLWEAYPGDKSAANQFRLGWMDGYISEDKIGPDKGDWFGWIMEEGTIVNSDQMVVQPGFYNGGIFISRSYEGIEGDWYRRMNWDRVLLNKPSAVTIISFVGDSEQNDVYNMRTGDYPEEMDRTEHWSYPEMYWEMTKDYVKEYRKIRNNEITRMAEYGKGEIQRDYLNVYFAEPFNDIPVVYTTLEGESGDEEKEIKIVKVTESSFLVRVNGGISPTAKFNWLAVMPGYWETSNGMKLAAGRQNTNNNKVRIDVNDHFENTPALFSMLNSSRNGYQIATRQVSLAGSSYTLSTSPERKSAMEEDICWIAIETGKAEMWTGRFCTALTTAIENQGSFEFSLPRYFYDDVLTLVKSSGGDNGPSNAPMVLNTTNLGGRISYQAGSEPSSDLLNIVCFDGGGGSLYGLKRK